MGRIIKLLVVVVVIGGGAGLISYAGAFMKMKSYLGADLPDLGPRSWEFRTKVPELNGEPMAWRFTYASTQMRGLPSITIFVSPTGDILGTIPSNLKARLEPYRRQIP